MRSLKKTYRQVIGTQSASSIPCTSDLQVGRCPCVAPSSRRVGATHGPQRWVSPTLHPLQINPGRILHASEPIPAQLHHTEPAGDDDDVALQPLALQHRQDDEARPRARPTLSRALPQIRERQVARRLVGILSKQQAAAFMTKQTRHRMGRSKKPAGICALTHPVL